MARYRVVEPYQVNLDGTVHGPGEQLDADETAVSVWLTAGILEPVAESKQTRKKVT